MATQHSSKRLTSAAPLLWSFFSSWAQTRRQQTGSVVKHIFMRSKLVVFVAHDLLFFFRPPSLLLISFDNLFFQNSFDFFCLLLRFLRFIHFFCVFSRVRNHESFEIKCFLFQLIAFNVCVCGGVGVFFFFKLVASLFLCPSNFQISNVSYLCSSCRLF